MAIVNLVAGHDYAIVLENRYFRHITISDMASYDTTMFVIIDITGIVPVPQLGWYWNGTVFIDPNTITLSGVPSLTLIGAKEDYSVTDATVSSYVLEVWDSLTNDRATATIKTGGYKPNETRYVWARYRDYLGSFGVWNLAATAGQVVVIDPITSANTANSLVSSSAPSVTAPSSTINIINYGQFYNKGYVQWTASENEVVSFSIAVSLEISNIVHSATPAADILSVILRTYLYDVTASAAVEGTFKYSLPFKLIGTKQYGALMQNVTINDSHLAGFRGSLTPGHQYRFAVDVGKFIGSATTPTMSVDTNDSNGFSGLVSFSKYS